MAFFDLHWAVERKKIQELKTSFDLSSGGLLLNVGWAVFMEFWEWKPDCCGLSDYSSDFTKSQEQLAIREFHFVKHLFLS